MSIARANVLPHSSHDASSERDLTTSMSIMFASSKRLVSSVLDDCVSLDATIIVKGGSISPSLLPIKGISAKEFRTDAAISKDMITSAARPSCFASGLEMIFHHQIPTCRSSPPRFTHNLNAQAPPLLFQCSSAAAAVARK
jgi:hypothetical protein